MLEPNFNDPTSPDRRCHHSTRGRVLACGVLVGLAAAATPALAHHPLSGQSMGSFAHGLLSGVGHPLLGFDHLFFVVLMGIVACYTGRARLATAVYVGAMLLGCLVTAFAGALSIAEPMVMLSLLFLGGVAVTGRALKARHAAALFAGAGIFHGMAFGESMASAEAGAATEVLFGYLLGLGVIQYLLALGAGRLMSRVLKADSALDMQPRLAGAAVLGVGLFLALEQAETVAFAALRLG